MSVTPELKEDNASESKVAMIICNNLILDFSTSNNTVPFTKYHFLKYYGKCHVIRGILYSNNKEKKIKVKKEQDDTELVETFF